MNDPLLEKLRLALSAYILKTETLSNHCLFEIESKHLVDVLKLVKNEYKFDQLLDIVAIDWQNQKEKRFELAYLLYAVSEKSRLTLRVLVNENELVPSAHAIYPSANWAERECFDMMGIAFEGHPHLKRLLMWNTFIGHPLQKNYPLQRRQPLPVQEDLLS